jgi:hypothetical protein
VTARTPRWKGFTARLQSPADLLVKMVHDLGRMEIDPNDVYAAFDFFIAAEHIVDWRYPDNGDQAKRDETRRHDPARTVSHLASGAKHFHATATRHTSVRGVEADQDDGNLAMMLPGGLELVITMADGREVSALELAHLVVDYWATELGPFGTHAVADDDLLPDRIRPIGPPR